MDLETDIKDLKILYNISISKLEKEIELGKNISPKSGDILKSLSNLSIDEIKVIIVGQDPYFNEGEANGIAFSVNKGIKIPPSLKNIYKELHNDLGIPIPNHGDLTYWKNQGVLLLNRVLSVEINQAKSHSNKFGWEFFTEKLIMILNTYGNNKVFVLWGNSAKELESIIDKTKHLVLTAAHPSPLSATKGFFGCKHFSQINNYLISNGQKEIDWDLNQSK